MKRPDELQDRLPIEDPVQETTPVSDNVKPPFRLNGYVKIAIGLAIVAAAIAVYFLT